MPGETFGSGGFRSAGRRRGARVPPRPDSLAWLAPRRRERGDEVDGDCRRMGARAAGALPVRQRRALRSRLAPGAAPGGGRGAAGAVRGAPGSGHSPARSTARPGVCYGLPHPSARSAAGPCGYVLPGAGAEPDSPLTAPPVPSESLRPG